ncbi:hypothetical cytosolic protein [Syntrophus aciditrophicus SB]|uniref:Hypothetical cytosolic protein n=1 Tax=Syntrophus aciditrophicus (strain SB) TaxID=56780 RepID=Q2LV66_SYNAS|nr:hypothetical cytosolic protein [Syntrophus aciditrophicus SB]
MSLFVAISCITFQYRDDSAYFLYFITFMAVEFTQQKGQSGVDRLYSTQRERWILDMHSPAWRKKNEHQQP